MQGIVSTLLECVAEHLNQQAVQIVQSVTFAPPILSIFKDPWINLPIHNDRSRSHSTTDPWRNNLGTLRSALEEEENMLLELGFPQQRIDFFVLLYQKRSDIADLGSYHLGLSSQETCTTGRVDEWIHGSFNVCIPLYVSKEGENPEKRALIRFPLPYKLGESQSPGNVDEKLRCEAATYIWIQENCPDVSIPTLWGFGFVGGKSVSQICLIGLCKYAV